jgi:soluble lytic murein transglycosylase-like protein
LSSSRISSNQTGGEGGCLSSCLQQALFIFLAVALAAAVIGAGLDGGSAANLCGCRVNHRFPQAVLRWCGLITGNAEASELDPDLLAALIWQESGGNAKAYSHSGAVGLMQVMPHDGLAASFTCRGAPCFADRPSIAQLQDPNFNVQFGTRLLEELVDKHGGDLREALHEYGPVDAGYAYADTVLALYREYGEQ